MIFLLNLLTILTKSNNIIKLNKNHIYHDHETYLKIYDKEYIYVNDYNLNSINRYHIDKIHKNIKVKMNGIIKKKGSNCRSFYNWGLDRLYEKDLNINCKKINNYVFNDDIYTYVLDTGIDTKHFLLKNVEWGTNCISNDNKCGIGNGVKNDDNGHGTHVAGIISGLGTGVLQNSKVISVKVLNKDGNGSLFDVFKGLNWVKEHIKKNNKKGIINLSLGSIGTDLFSEIIEDLYNDNILIVSAAGNENIDSCLTSPASAPKSITVASSNKYDNLSSFSNYGDCVDIIAPGENIMSSSNDNGMSIASGTSMSAPHVVGTLALIWSYNLHLNNKEVEEYLFNIVSKNKIKNLNKNTINNLLYSKIHYSKNLKYYTYFIYMEGIKFTHTYFLNIYLFYILSFFIIILIIYFIIRIKSCFCGPRIEVREITEPEQEV